MEYIRKLRILEAMLKMIRVSFFNKQMETRIMLKTSEERVRLLRNGIERKKIEELYIQYNRLKIIKSPILFDFIETPLQESPNSPETPAIKLKQTCQTDGDMISMSVLADAS
ncbi:MAG: hypothetical protein KKI06_09150 [Euryarchaeota archaeon]|nr:hypothetical protein [Euryarchaeota archaeon]